MLLISGLASTKAGGGAFAYLVLGDLRSGPSTLAVVTRASEVEIVDPIPQPNGFPKHLDVPTAGADLIQYAYSIVKLVLQNMRSRYGPCRTPKVAYKICPILPMYNTDFNEAFAFRGSTKVKFDLMHDRTALWDNIFGHDWDVVIDRRYVVTRLTFRKAPLNTLSK
jgi:hypothetical protein